jgi:hypothetical protein
MTIVTHLVTRLLTAFGKRPVRPRENTSSRLCPVSAGREEASPAGSGLSSLKEAPGSASSGAVEPRLHDLDDDPRDRGEQLPASPGIGGCPPAVPLAFPGFAHFCSSFLQGSTHARGACAVAERDAEQAAFPILLESTFLCPSSRL